MNLSKLKLIFSLAMLVTCMFFFNACTKEDGPAPAPSITSFSPDSGLEGDEVVITGQNFSTTASENIVKFNGTSATVTAATATKLTVTVPEGASSGKITVSMGGETATSAQDFTVFNSPLISSFSPESGVTGDEITINGENFNPTASENTVKFNGTPATVTSATATKLIVSVPEGATTGQLTVSVNGQLVTSTNDFTVLYPPEISSFSPEKGVEGDEITITGENFSTTVSDNTVEFNGVSATVTAASATSLTVVVPSGVSTGKIMVTVNGQTATSTGEFTILFIKQLAAGNHFTIILKSDNTLWATGSNSVGQLGDGTNTDTNIPKQIMGGVKAVAVGGEHTLILKYDNTLWATGFNANGQLGNGANTSVKTPEQIMEDVKAVEAGDRHTLILKTDNTLWVTGRNDYGQLGDGTTTDTNIPKQIMEGVKAVAARGEFSLILKTDNTLWVTGRNDYGQLGDGTTTHVNVPKQVMEGVKVVAAGGGHALILKEDNTLWATGHNGKGQIGDGTTTHVSVPKQIMEGVMAMAGGPGHTLIMKIDNTLWVCGSNSNGQLGDGTTNDISTPIQIMEGVKAITAGGLHTLIFKQDNTLWATGSNTYGQLGDGTTNNTSIPIQINF